MCVALKTSTSNGTWAGPELRDRLVLGVVRAGRDLAVELLAELLERARVDVVRVVEKAKRSALGLQALGGIGLSSVIAHSTLLSLRGSGRPPGPAGLATTRFEASPPPPCGDRPLAGAVLAGADGGGRVLTGGERADRARAGYGRGGAAQELLARNAGSVLRMSHRPTSMRRRFRCSDCRSRRRHGELATRDRCPGPALPLFPSLLDPEPARQGRQNSAHGLVVNKRVCCELLGSVRELWWASRRFGCAAARLPRWYGQTR